MNLNRPGNDSKPWKFNPSARGQSPPPVIVPKIAAGGLQPLSRQSSLPPSPRSTGQAVMGSKMSAALRPPATKVEEEMSRQVAEWDAQMDGLDKQQEQLLNDQWRLLRTQIGSLMGALSDMRGELASIKEAAVGHGQAHASVMERVGYLEDFIGESADKSKSLSGKHEELKTTQTTLESRVEYLEGVVGDSATKHGNDIATAMGKLHDLHAAVQSCAKAEHHASLEERMQFVEKELGESADKHDAHKTSVEDRMEFLENKMGDSAEKHWKEIQAAKAKLGDIHKAVQQCAKQEHHSSLEERMRFVEKELGESSDKHDAHKTSMEDRMEFLEKKMGDSAEKHWKEIQAAKAKLGDVHKAVASCAKQEHHASLEERILFCEKELGESADKHDKHKTSIEDRMEFLETKVGDSAEKHWKEIQEAKAKLGDIHKAVATCAKHDHASSLDKRLGFLEGMVGDNADKHAKAFKDHKNGLDEHKESMETRLKFLEALLGDSADKHWKEIDAAKKKLGSIESAVSKCAKAEHHANLEERLAYLEKDLGDSVDDHTKHKNSIGGRLDGMEKKLKDFGIVLDGKGHKSEIEKLEAVVLAGIDKRLTTVEEKHLQDFLKRLGDYEKKHMQEFEQVKSKIGEVDKALKECANIEHYLGLDRKHGALTEQQAAHAEAVKGRMRDIVGKLDAQRSSLDNYKAAIDDRFSQLEGAVAEGTQASELLKDMEHRLNYMQEDQKRARDILESSMQEQIRLEHSAVHSQANQIKEQWDRELRARQAYQESYKDLLGQERTAREAQDLQFVRRVERFEKSISAEIQRVWQEVGKEAPSQVIFQQPPQQVLKEYIMSPRMSPLPSYVSGASVTVAPPQLASTTLPIGSMTVEAAQARPVITRQMSNGTFVPTTYTA